MLINVVDPIKETLIFSAIFFSILFLSVTRSKKIGLLTKEKTTQLKGFAILTIIFGHIGYFLTDNNQFLYPLSVASGVGVNLFLFLSGFGLTISEMRTPLSIIEFYKKRLLKIFIPLWLILTAFLFLDFLINNRIYTSSEIIYSFLGFYPVSDLVKSIDSPLWYFSFILLFYLIFPIFYIKRFPILSPFLMIGFLYFLSLFNYPIHMDVFKLYKLHFLAFSLGMFFAVISSKLNFKLNNTFRIFLMILLFFIFCYFSIYSGVGTTITYEQFVSILTTITAVLFFVLLDFDFRLLNLFGVFSYEVYLIHWPILSRFNLFTVFPPFLMVILNIIFIIVLSYIMQRIVNLISLNLKIK